MTVVANELRGARPVGGMGTATTFLALALSRMGHSVELLRGWRTEEAIDPYWERIYGQAGIRVRAAPQSSTSVEPGAFWIPYDIQEALRADPPDVVVAHDLAAPAYAALRQRDCGLAFENTLFVVFCHGTRGWILDMSRRISVPDLHHVLRTGVLERMSVELADVVVSPSAYLVGWMKQQGWQLPERTLVIPYLTQSTATGEDVPAQSSRGERATRITFFGRLEEKKGIGSFTAGLNTVDPALLDGIELEFLGKATATWTRDRVLSSLSKRTRDALRSVSFVTELDQPSALERLTQKGTVAVIPSLGDNSPNTVYECLERGIPFLASTAGGIPELITAEDRPRVLFDPMAEGVAEAITQVLTDEAGLVPARAAFDSTTSIERWSEVMEMVPQERPRVSEANERIDVIVVDRGAGQHAHCVSALDTQTYAEFEVTLADARHAGIASARTEALHARSAEWALILDEEDVPEPALLERLVLAQQASGADVVTCGHRIVGDGRESICLFSGEPGALGTLANDYGTVALIRRSVLARNAVLWGGEDADWPLYVALSLSGARIVSVPEPLLRRRALPGTVERTPADALIVARQFERALPDAVRVTARLAAGLAAAQSAAAAAEVRRNGAVGFARSGLRRLLRRWRHLPSPA